MHFEILVEDQSGQTMLENLLPAIIRNESTYQFHHYKGIGHIPKGLRPRTDSRKRILLDQLPRIISGFGKTHAGFPADYRAAIIVICDLDTRNLRHFLQELNAVVEACHPRPETEFCIAVEEGEAWLLGDREAVITAYPDARAAILDSYDFDSICGTWEKLADAVYPGGSTALKKLGNMESGKMKSIWATQISRHIDPERNRSPSFQHFRETISRLSLET